MRAWFWQTLLCLISISPVEPARGETSLPASCDLSPIEQPLTGAGYDGVRPRRITMTFQPQIFRDETLGVERTVVVPTILLGSDVSEFVNNRRSELEAQVRKEVDDAGLDLTSFAFNSLVPAGPKLIIGGNLEVEKWWKTKWVCCKWLSCRTCWAKGRIFSRSVDFSVDVFRNYTPVPVKFLSQSASLGEARAPTTLRAEGITALQLQASGRTDTSRSTLEQIWDVIGGVFQWVDHEIFSGNSTWKFSEWLDKTFDKGIDGPDPYLFQRQLYNFGTPKGTSDNLIGRRWFWQSFVTGLKLDQMRTGFEWVESSPSFSSVFKLDYQKYSKLMNPNDLGVGRGGLISNPLVADMFCSKEGRAMVEAYLASVRDGFNKTEQAEETVQIARQSLQSELERRYGVTGIDVYLRSAMRIRRQPNDPKAISANLPAVAQLTKAPGIVPTGGNIWAIAREQGWTRKEYLCAIRLAKRRTNNENLVFPFHSFESCLNTNEFSNRQLSFLKSVSSSLLKSNASEIASAFSAPVSGGYEYRGWHYCHEFSTICIGNERILWWQNPSIFKSRGGRQLGVDIVSSEGNEAIQLSAVAGGVVKYTHFRNEEWGHALLLPFLKDARSFIAVYANLPKTAREFDGVKVEAGQSLGLAGCTQAATAPDGHCNRKCVVNGVPRSDAHLHFEMIEVTERELKKVDPVEILGLRPALGSDQRVYNCRS